jgi:hypothetical protein
MLLFNIGLLINQMLSFFWAGFSFFALPIAQANFETPSLVSERSPETARYQSVEAVDPYFDEPFCYIRMSDGSIIVLTNLCGQNSTLSRSIYPRSPQAYNTRAIRAFDDSVYGAGN